MEIENVLSLESVYGEDRMKECIISIVNQSLSKRKQRLKNKLAIPQSMSLKDAIIKSQLHLSI